MDRATVAQPTSEPAGRDVNGPTTLVSFHRPARRPNIDVKRDVTVEVSDDALIRCFGTAVRYTHPLVSNILTRVVLEAP